MAGFRIRFIIVFIFSLTQLCVSEPLIKFSYQRPIQTANSAQPAQPQTQPQTTPQTQSPIATKLGQVREKLRAFIQKKLAELQLLVSAFSPNATNAQLPPGQQPTVQFPILSQLAGSLQNILPALQSAAMNTPVLPPAQTAPGQQMPGLPTGTGQPLGGQPLAGQPLGGQPLAGQPLSGQPLAGQPLAGQPLAGQPGSPVATQGGQTQPQTPVQSQGQPQTSQSQPQPQQG